MRHNAMWGGVIALPVVPLLMLLGGIIPDPAWEGPRFHFLVVSFTTALALVMALLMVRAASQPRDVRVFFLTLTYLSIAGIFLRCCRSRSIFPSTVRRCMPHQRLIR